MFTDRLFEGLELDMSDIERDAVNDEDHLEHIVNTYNTYADDTMKYREIDPDYYALYIGGYEITTGDIFDLIDRISGINRENGFTYLDEWN